MTWQGYSKPTDTPQFGNTADAYARHRLGFPASMFDRLQAEGLLTQDCRLLDLGTGTGAFARAAATRGAKATALDIDAAMLQAGRTLASQQGVAVAFKEAPAEETGEPNNRYDLVSAGQCWHWFDRTKAAREANRVLVPGGALLICHYDWLPQAGNVVEATEALILRYNPAWKAAGGAGLYPAWADDLKAAGFQDIQSFDYDEPATYSHEAWVGRILASAGIAILDSAHREEFRQALHALLATQFPTDPLSIAHKVFVIWGVKPTGASEISQTRDSQP